MSCHLALALQPGYDMEEDGAWLSLAERSVWDREVAGSNPAAPTNDFTLAGMVKRYHMSLPSSWCGFDSRCPL